MRDVIESLYEVILARKESGDTGSYTAYLFREGLDKILKKCGEECSEVIIAAKSLQAERGRCGADQSGSAQSGGLQPGGAQPDTLQSDDMQSGGAQSGTLQSDGTQSGNAQSHDVQSGSLQVGGASDDKAADLKNEICDLLYHLLVLMAEAEIPLVEIETILRERAAKTGNLKTFKTVDKDS